MPALGSVPEFMLVENCRYSGYRSGKVFHPFPICQTIAHHLQPKTSVIELQSLCRSRAVGCVWVMGLLSGELVPWVNVGVVVAELPLCEEGG